MLRTPACLQCASGRADSQRAGWPSCPQVLHLLRSHLLLDSREVSLQLVALLDQLLLGHCQLRIGIGQVVVLGGQQGLQGTRWGQLQKL